MVALVSHREKLSFIVGTMYWLMRGFIYFQRVKRPIVCHPENNRTERKHKSTTTVEVKEDGGGDERPRQTPHWILYSLFGRVTTPYKVALIVFAKKRIFLNYQQNNKKKSQFKDAPYCPAFLYLPPMNPTDELSALLATVRQ